MTFQDSVKVCFSKYADFEGRASRPEYWWFFLFILLVSAATAMVGPVVSGLFQLATLLPALAAGARRLHDTNRSGWWQLIVFVPLVGFIVLIYFLAQPSKSETSASSA